MAGSWEDFNAGDRVVISGGPGTVESWRGVSGTVLNKTQSFVIVRTTTGQECGFWPCELAKMPDGSGFEVGDRFKVVGPDGYGDDSLVGETGTIVEVDDPVVDLIPFYVMLDGGYDAYVGPGGIEKLDDVEPEVEPRVEGGVILTKTGRYVDPLNLDVNEIDVEDVAHALSNQCRFSGHVSAFYSVAEHSVRVAGLLEAMGEPAEVCLWGLLHDATEAYLVDLPSPLKLASELGPPYLAAESRAQDAVADAFDLPRGIPEAVKAADMVLLATERRDLMPPVGEWAILDGVEPLATTIVPCEPDLAYASFLDAYEDLVAWRSGVRPDFVIEVDADEPDEKTFEGLKKLVSTPTVFSETKATNPKDAVGSDKLPLHLWPPTATALGALGLLDGMLKYGRTNWREAGVKASIYVDALGRHVGAWFEGEDKDPDSGLPHLAHALACLAILVDADSAGKLVDDRQYGGDGWRAFVEALTPHVARLKAKHADKSPRHFTIEDERAA